MLKALLNGVTMGLFLAISVGPILFTVINHRLNHGIKGGFAFVAGIWLSDLLFVVLSNMFTVFTTAFATRFIQPIGYAGGLLLIGLGAWFIFFKSAYKGGIESEQTTAITNATMLKLFGSGFLINTINPILFFEWLSAATVFAGTYTVANRVVLFIACLAVNILSDIMKIFLAGKIKQRLTAQHLKLIDKGTGAVLFFCGFLLLYQTWFHAAKWMSITGS